MSPPYFLLLLGFTRPVVAYFRRIAKSGPDPTVLLRQPFAAPHILGGSWRGSAKPDSTRTFSRVFENLRQNIHEEYRQVVVRRIFTVTGTRPDEETVEHLIETGNSEQIYEKAIHGQGRGQIIDTLAEIQERCDTAKDIEKKLYDLQQMFMDMSVLVEAQGDLLDDIETQVSKAVDHVNSAQVALHKGKKQQRNTRKYMCCALILLLVILIIALGAALKTIKAWKNI